jgi:phytoene desaturase
MPRLSYGSSAFLLYLGLDCRYPQLNHHDVYLSGDVGANFDAIFRRLELPEDPSFYTCAPSRTDPTLAPPGHDAIYVLVPVPHLSVKVDWRRERDGFRERVYDRLEAAGLRDLRRHLRFERVYTPLDFASDYNLARGSAFGISHNFLQVGYMRPANKAPRLEGLYFVGASTQPGGGVPMVIIGSRLTAERIEGDRIHG